MAGVKGKSGGPRKNSGGARPGAGRKPKAKADAKSANAGQKLVVQPPCVAGESQLPVTEEPLAFLLAVQNSTAVDIKTRVRAAIAAAQYKHTKLHDGGKKDATAGKAQQAATGRFSAPSAPPRLAVAGGKRVA